MKNELTLRFDTQEELEEDMASMLRKCGWTCSKGLPWQTPKEIQTEFRIGPQTLTMRLRRFRERGGDFPTRRGTTGRILAMQVTSDLRAYFEKLKG